MKLIQLKVKNYRCFKKETSIDFENVTVLIGRNDSGKSSILDALNIFFNDGLEQDDVCVHGSDTKLIISCVFDDLPKELIIDEQYPTDLAAEHLLNKEGMLEIVKEFNCSGSGKPRAPNVFARAWHPSEEKYNDLMTLTNAKLKQRAKELGVDLASVNQTINTDIRRAIWAHASDLKYTVTDIELKSDAAQKIWEQLKKHLPVFALFKSDRPSTDQDGEAQDPMKSAIKEAIKNQEATLNEIAEEVKREVQGIADRTVEKIREMNPELAKQLTPRVKNKNWDSLFSVTLTGDEDIPINKRGSGTRRLVLINFFRAKAEKDAEGKGAGIIYAIEEPETSQHPNNQKMLIEAFENLASMSDCQVLLTTHTPVLARRFTQASLRYVMWQDDHPVIHSGCDDTTLTEIVDSLGVLPDHNIKVFFGVEGRNDISFLRTISKTLSAAEEDIPDLEQAEYDGHLVFVPLGGSSLDLWVSKLQGLNRQEFYLMDRDTEPPSEPKYKATADKLRQQQNTKVWTTSKSEIENYIPGSLIKSVYPGYMGTGDDYEDVPMLLAQAIHEADGSGKPWEEVKDDPEKLKKKESNAKRRLCAEFVSKMTPEMLNEVDKQNDIRTWLKAIGETLNAH